VALLSPERYFSRISSIDIQRDLMGAGFCHVLRDVDNTILSRATHDIPRDVGVWLGKARTAGVEFCLVSNNWHASVHQLAGVLDVPVVGKSCKPLPQGFLLGLAKVGGTRKNTVVVGDQLLTDVLGAHLVGLPVYMVQPLVEVDLPHTMALRNFERAVLGNRRPEPVSVVADDPSRQTP